MFCGFFVFLLFWRVVLRVEKKFWNSKKIPQCVLEICESYWLLQFNQIFSPTHCATRESGLIMTYINYWFWYRASLIGVLTCIICLSFILQDRYHFVLTWDSQQIHCETTPKGFPCVYLEVIDLVDVKHRRQKFQK